MDRAARLLVLFTTVASFLQEGTSLEMEMERHLQSRQVMVPTVSNFRRRAMLAVAVMDNYLYIDGGEMSQFVNGGADTVPSRGVNVTISLPLDASWTNATVPLRSIPRIPRPAKYTALWPDPAGKRVYLWGGEGPYQAAATAADGLLYALAPDGGGGAAWDVVGAANPDAFAALYRGTQTTAATCAGVGYSLGGLATAASDAKVAGAGTLAIPGLVAYDFATRLWANRTVPFPQSTTQLGQSACAPFGAPAAKGLVVFVGGAFASLTNADSAQLLPMNNISFYDAAADRWHWQTATGDALPGGRHGHCSVGVAGSNGTYEIFVYGGHDPTASPEVLSDVWVLTLPGFRWFRADAASDPAATSRRWMHACALAGRRQMISVGGVSLYAGGFELASPPADPWPQGIAVLDLQAMKWADKYDPVAPPYDSPDVVKAWYSNGGLKTVAWSSDEVKAMFINGTTESPPSTPPPPPGESSGPNVGAIVGGVIAATVVLALAALAFLWYRRRQRRIKARPYIPGGGDDSIQDTKYTWLGGKAELDHNPSQSDLPSELPQREPGPHELPVPVRHYELPSGDVRQDQWRRGELPG